MKNVTTLLFILFSFELVAQYKYPVSKMVDSTDTYFGITYKDPYRWIEHIKEPEVESWFKAQADYSNSILNKLSGRDELIAEYKKLDKLQPSRIRARVYANGRYFYRKTEPGENVGKLFYRLGVDGKEQLLFDPTTFIKGKTLTIESILPSHDGKKVVIGYSEKGAELSTLKIMDVDSRTFLADEIYPSDGSYSWTFDNKSFLYGWIKSADNKDPSAWLNPKTKLHVVGTPTNMDKDFFSNESYPLLKIDPSVYPYAMIGEESPNYIFSGELSVQNELKQYYAPISQFHTAKIQWKELVSPKDKVVRGFETIGEEVYAITYNNAKNYKLISVNLKNPDWNNAATIAAEKPDQTLESINFCKDYLFIIYSDGINNHVYKYNLHTKVTTEVNLPFNGTVDVFSLNKKSNDLQVIVTSWIKPATEFNYNADTDVFSPSSFNKAPVYPAEYNNLEVSEVEVKGHDGVMIPLSIVYKKGTKLDGSNVCLLDAYGAYGFSATPYFSVLENALAVKGVVMAYPHVRGGSEKGEAWYKAGYKTTKPNTWKDFISCAEYMIAKGYTSSGKIAGTGTSAGGILITRAITERPDLFTAAICNVGCANTMRGEFSANGPVNVPEFGTVKDSVECKALYEMDGMQHVIKDVKYPAVISVAGWNDSRVVAWQPGKFAAAVQNASSSGKPVLLKINYDNGHFTEDKSVTYANFADQFSFVLWQCGHPDFQMKK